MSITYGALTYIDVEVLEEVLAHYHGRTLRFLEVGVHTGTTARGIDQYCRTNKIALEYWGLDNGAQWDGQLPFAGAHMVKGDSAESAHLIPDFLDVALVDGCHCFNHAILDTVLYGEKVVAGGFLLHHDIAPHIQQSMRDPHGPDTPRFHNSVNEALEAIRWPWPPWVLHRYTYDGNSPWGGMMSHRKG